MDCGEEVVVCICEQVHIVNVEMRCQVRSGWRGGQCLRSRISDISDSCGNVSDYYLPSTRLEYRGMV